MVARRARAVRRWIGGTGRTDGPVGSMPLALIHRTTSDTARVPASDPRSALPGLRPGGSPSPTPEIIAVLARLTTGRATTLREPNRASGTGRTPQRVRLRDGDVGRIPTEHRRF